MNVRGQVRFVAFMFALTIFIMAIAFAPAIQQTADQARNATLGNTNSTERQLDCDNSSIDDFKKASCVLVDVTPSYFVGMLFGIAGLIIIGRLMR